MSDIKKRADSFIKMIDCDAGQERVVKRFQYSRGGIVNIEGWYYLHENGSMIYKRELGGTIADLRESDFVIMCWPINTQDRASAWRILVEAGAIERTDKARLKELADKWGCDDEDAENYAQYIGIKVYKDGGSWCATRSDFINLQESTAGFGDTAREAMSDLCKNLGYKPQKMWGTLFEKLVCQ